MGFSAVKVMGSYVIIKDTGYQCAFELPEILFLSFREEMTTIEFYALMCILP